MFLVHRKMHFSPALFPPSPIFYLPTLMISSREREIEWSKVTILLTSRQIKPSLSRGKGGVKKSRTRNIFFCQTEYYFINLLLITGIGFRLSLLDVFCRNDVSTCLEGVKFAISLPMCVSLNELPGHLN